MPRLRLFLSYDGTRYNGWQRQKNTANTIQEILENKLSTIANTKVIAVASGRTDAGVHARIQCVHCDVPATPTILRLIERKPVAGRQLGCRLLQSLNMMLPSDIRALELDEVPQTFHAQRSAQQKTYLYYLNTAPVQLPELRDRAWHLRLPLDWKAIKQATAYLRGTHDFRAFCASDSTAKTSVRTLYEARWGNVHWKGIAASSDLRVLRLTGSGFLKNMVRVIVGSLIHIGSGKARPEVILDALETRDRTILGPTAPPHGLWLWDLKYPS